MSQVIEEEEADERIIKINELTSPFDTHSGTTVTLLVYSALITFVNGIGPFL